MAKFSYGEHLTQAESVISGKLGASANQYVDGDVGHAVKLTADSRWVKCASGDQIEGFIKSIEPFTVEGYSFGGVQIGGFKEVTVVGPIAIGDYVMAGAAGASGNPGKLLKETAVTVGDATTVRYHKWRYVSGAVSGTATDCVGVVMRVA